eukprot:m.69528 g.69528  ORF g.69528 m.69528 type:complete len:500 (-) comp7823_c0_seq1:314-1813(-)
MATEDAASLPMGPLSPITNFVVPTPSSVRRPTVAAKKRKYMGDENDDEANAPLTPAASKKRRSSMAANIGQFVSPFKFPRTTRSMSTRSLRKNTMTSRVRIPATSETQEPSSWVETLGDSAKDIVRDVEPREIKRQEAIYEITSGEKRYVGDLNYVMKVFFSPMLAVSCITEAEQTDIFSNLDKIAELHNGLSAAFHKARDPFSGISELGSILSLWIPRFVAYGDYCGNQIIAKHVFESKMQHNESFREFVERASSLLQSRRMNLWSFLDSPRRRLQRYPLLLQAVLKYTPEDHPDHSALTKAIANFKAVLAKVDEMVELSSRSQIAKFQQSLVFASQSHHIDLIEDRRPLKLILDVIVKEKPAKMHLFQHMLLITKDSKKEKDLRAVIGMPFELESLIIDNKAADDITVKIWSEDYGKMGSVRGTLRNLAIKKYSLQFLQPSDKNKFLCTVMECRASLDTEKAEKAKLEKEAQEKAARKGATAAASRAASDDVIPATL